MQQTLLNLAASAHLHDWTTSVDAMKRFTNGYVLWVTSDDSNRLTDAILRERAGAVAPDIEVRTRILKGKWDIAVIPAGSRDEWGTIHRAVLNVSSGQLPPDGRVYVVGLES